MIEMILGKEMASVYLEVKRFFKSSRDIFLDERLLYVCEQASYSVGSFVFLFMLARKLGVEEFGRFSSLYLIMMLFVILETSFVLQYHTVKAATRKNIISRTLLPGLISFFPVGLLIGFYVSIDYGYQFSLAFFLLLGFRFFNEFNRRVCVLDGEFYKQIIINIFSLFGLLLGLVLADEVDYFYAIYLLLVVYGVGSLIYSVINRYKYNVVWNRRYLIRSLKIMFVSNGWMIFVAIFAYMSAQFLPVVLSKLATPKDAGYLMVILSYLGLSQVLLQALNVYYLKKTAGLLTGIGNPKGYSIATSIGNKMAVIMMVVLLPMVLFSDYFIKLLYGSDFDVSFSAVVFVYLYFVLMSKYQGFANYHKVYMKTKLIFYSSLSAMMLVYTAGAMVFKDYGYEGASVLIFVGVVSSYVVLKVLTRVDLRKARV